MERLVDGFAELFSYDITTDGVRMEVLLAGADLLPPDPGVVHLDLRDVRSERPLAEVMERLEDEFLSGIDREDTPEGIDVIVSVEGEALRLACAAVTADVRSPERRHYEKLIRETSDSLQLSRRNEARAGVRLGTIERFVAGQIDRAERLVDGLPVGGAAGVRAGARLKALREVWRVLRETEHAQQATE